MKLVKINNSCKLFCDDYILKDNENLLTLTLQDKSFIINEISKGKLTRADIPKNLLDVEIYISLIQFEYNQQQEKLSSKINIDLLEKIILIIKQNENKYNPSRIHDENGNHDLIGFTELISKNLPLDLPWIELLKLKNSMDTCINYLSLNKIESWFLFRTTNSIEDLEMITLALKQIGEINNGRK